MIDIVRLTQDFIDRYSGRPRIFRAPARVNLIGEHTDYNDGFVLPFAIDKAVLIAAASRNDTRITIASDAFPEILKIDVEQLDATPVSANWTRYPLGVLKLIKREGFEVSGADLLIASDIPSGAGLSSSAALEVGVATALRHLNDLDLREVDIAKIGQRTENEFAGVNSGIMDQMASVHGRAGHALFLDCRSLESQQIPLKGATFLVCDTRTKHSLAESEYNARRLECEQAAMALKKASLRDARIEEIGALPSPLKERARHVIGENARVKDTVAALRSEDLESVGRLVNESHASLRIDFEVSCRKLDLMAEICRSQPEVLGSRMMGGGFGGCTISICQDGSDLTQTASRIGDRYATVTGLDPVIFPCRPEDGAGEIIGLTN